MVHYHGFFVAIQDNSMEIFIYSDESGVFDREHEEYFVFAGIVLLGGEAISDLQHKYIHVEQLIKNIDGLNPEQEAKASCLSNKSKQKLYRSLNSVEKFASVVKLKHVLSHIFENKKSKQRYMDYAYKLGIKWKFQNLISQGKLNPLDVEALHFFVDEHNTATNGKYELRESLEQEFRFGTFNVTYESFYPPLFTNLKSVKVSYCNSQRVTLIRAADIAANRLYHLAKTDHLFDETRKNLSVKRLPRDSFFF